MGCSRQQSVEMDCARADNAAVNHDNARRLLTGISLFYAATVAYLGLYLYPVWREVQYQRYKQHPSTSGMGFDYLALAALVFVLAMLLPLVLAIPVRDKPLAWVAVFFITSVAMQAAFFMYAPRFAIEFPHVSFFSEFRNLKLVFSSPLTAAAAIAISWRLKARKRLSSDN